jgi:hypothetical protein
MTKRQESKDVPAMFTDERVLAWMEEHVTELTVRFRAAHSVREPCDWLRGWPGRSYRWIRSAIVGAERASRTLG